MKSYKTFKKELLRDKEIKKAYDELAPEFELAKMIIQKRQRLGLSQAELAKKIGTKQPAIARLESGAHNPSISFLKKTAHALDANLSITFN